MQWSKGEYAGASNTQDDLALITRHLPARDDDHGDSPATATPLGAASPGDARASPGPVTASVTGAIESPGDADWFSFDVAAGGPVTLSVSLVPDARVAGIDSLFGRANVDLRLQLLGPASPGDAASSPPLLASLDPRGKLLAGSYRVTLPAGGRYLVSLTGTGDGDASTGYTSYGSLGVSPFCRGRAARKQFSKRTAVS